MKHLKLYENFLNESLSANKKLSKKDADSVMALAKGTDTEEFMEEFAQVYGCAAEIWMGEKDSEKLKKMYATDKYVWMTLGGESRAGEDDSKVHSYTSKGWKMFADEQNEENYDAILYKEK